MTALQMLPVLVCVLIVTGVRLVAPSKWDVLPQWARRVPVVAAAVASAILPALQSGGPVDWNAVGDTAWVTGATGFGAVELLKVLPWSRVVAIATRVAAMLRGAK